jgi:hypothetical protein
LSSQAKARITLSIESFTHITSAGSTTIKNRILDAVVICTTGLITILAAYYILHKMAQVKEDVIYARRKARYVSPIFLHLKHDGINDVPFSGKRN